MYEHIVLTPLFLPDRHGGIEKIVHGLACNFDLSGDKVRVFAFSPNISKNKEEVIDGIRVSRISLAKHSDSFSQFFYNQGLMESAVLRQCLRQTPGMNRILHIHDWFVAMVGLQIARKHNIFSLAYFHGDKFGEHGNSMTWQRTKIHEWQKQLMEQTDYSLCYSRFMQSSLASSMRCEKSCIHLFNVGINPIEYRNAIRPNRLMDIKYKLLYAGRLASEKNVITLIRAMKLIWHKYPSVSLKIRGSGSEEAFLRQETIRMGLENVIQFCPFTNDHEILVKDLYDADGIILPSTFEPFGIIILEAIASKLPVIVPNVGGPSEIVCNGKTGYTFDPLSTVDLAEKVFMLFERRKYVESMVETAYDTVLKEYDWHKSIEVIRSIIDASDKIHYA
ncbi:MAG: glycosyltransferase family 4 protein [Bacteroidota bacterium]